ncbi:hypothetical protein A6B39_08830 [Mannheimia granulomatis]|uniref:ESPR-type extended signal peptide-containing protein n=1 Tax=Mannheimia granulomatis TaxID=85402 RepID=UPI001F44A4B9|nr:ESPR-type extended signal peptide-containing protein [Mannheimia granulomatis]QLB15550.1 hypothetical protein A6B39_08830 [Mannheimia granulomatis]
MNKIFKVIFNRTTQKLEVVSELAKSKGKAASSTDERGNIKLSVGILSGATIAAGMAASMLAAPTAQAAVVIQTVTNNGGGVTVATNTSQPTASSTAPYNYLNPGSLSYDNRSQQNAQRGDLYLNATTSAVVIGNNASAKEEKSSLSKASGIAIGDYSVAGGALSVAIGSFSRTSEIGSVALGTAARAEGFNSFAAMRQAAAIEDYSAAIGSSAWANKKASFAIGASATALGERSFAIGSGTPQTVNGNRGYENRRSIYDGQNNTLAAGTDAFSIGTKAKTNGNRSFAIGTNASSGGFKTEQHQITALGQVINADTAKVANDAFALGTNTSAQSNNSVAFSTNATANGSGSIAFGVNTNTTGEGAIAFGNASKAWKNNAISIGWNATSHAEKVISIGSHSNASKDGAMAIGDTAKSSGNNSIAIGYTSNVSGVNATAIGTRTNVTGEGATAIGFEANASSQYATAIAYNSSASGQRSLAVGVDSIANGLRSIAMGDTTNATTNDDIAIGSYAKTNTNQTLKGTQGGTMAIGVHAKADGDNAVAIGNNATAEHNSSIALGGKASGIGATNIGYQANTTGNSSVGIGYYAKSNGNHATAIGSQAKAEGTLSTAIGSNANASRDYSVALGASSDTKAEATQEENATVNGITYSGFIGQATSENYSVSVGSDSIKRQIKHVAAGNISASSTDAINGSQLYLTNQIIGNLATSVKENFGGNATVNSNGTITYTNIGETGKANIHDAIKAAKTEVQQGTNVNVTKTVGNGGQAIYTVNAYNTTVTAVPTNGKNYLKAESSFNQTTNTTNYNVSLTADAITDFTKDTDTKTGVIADPQDTSGYISVTEYKDNDQKKREGDDRTYIVGLSKKAITDFTKDTHVTGGTVSYDNQGNATATLNKNDDTTASVTGIKNNFVTNSTTAEDGKQVTLTRNDGGTVNIDLNKTVKAAVDEATNKGFGLQAQDGNNVSKKLGEFVEVVGGNNNINTTVADGKVKVNLNNTLDLGNDGSVTIGGSKLDQNGLTINGGPNVTKTGIDAGSKKITNLEQGEVSATSKDAVNGSQLYATNQNVTNVTNKVDGGFNISADNGNPDNVKLGDTVKFTDPDANIITTVSDNQIKFALNSTLSVGGKNGKDGSVGVKGQDGENGVTINGNGTVIVGKDGQPGSVGINGKDGTIGINGKDGSNATMTVEKGAPGLDGASGKDGKTGEKTSRVVYTNEKNEKEEIANLNDGLRFTGNNEVENKHKLNSLVTIIGEGVTKEQSTAFQSATGNINVVADGSGNLTVKLAKNLNLTDSGSVTIGGTTVNQEGITINNGPKITNEGGNIKVGNTSGEPVKITNIKEGELSETSKDAVNGSQLYATNQNITNLTNKVGEGFNIDADNRGEGLDKADNVQLGETVKYTSTDKNIITTVTNNTIDFGLSDTISVGGKPGKDGTPGKDGSVGVKGADGRDGVTVKPKAIVFHGIDGVNGKNGADGANGEASIKVEKGAKGLDGNDGKDGESKTRIVYEKPNGEKEEVATLNDGLKFGANNGTVHNAKLNTQVDVKGAAGNTEWSKFDAGQNIMTQIANNTITVALAKDLAGLNSAKFGTDSDSTVINKDGVTIAKKDPNDATKSNVTLTEDGLSNGGNQITNVDSGLKGQDGQTVELKDAAGNVLKNAVNVGDLKNIAEKISTDAFGLKDKEGNEFKQNLGTTAQITGDNNVNTKVIDVQNADGTTSKALEVSLNNDLSVGKDGKAGSIGVKGQDGKDGVSIKGDDGENGVPGEASVVVGRDGADGIDGKVGVNGKNGASVVLNGKDGSIGLTGPKGADGQPGASTNITVKNGAQGVNGQNGENGLPGATGENRIVYKNGNNEEQVANLNDGLIFTGNNVNTLNRHKLNTLVKVQGEGVSKEDSESFSSAAGNINVKANGSDVLEIQLRKDLKDLNSATFDTKENGKPKTVVNNNGITITPTTEGKNPVKLTENGLDNGNNQIVNVKSGIDGQSGQDGQPVKSVNDLTDEQLKSVGTNAANIKDIRNATDALVNTGFNITADNKDLANGEDKDNVKLGETVTYTSTDKNIVTTVRDNAIDFGLASNLTVGKDGKDGQPGEAGTIGVKGQDGKNGVSIKGDDGKNGQSGEASVVVGRNGKDGDNGIDGKVGVNGKDGSAVVLNGKDGSIGLNGRDGQDGLTFKSENGAQGVDGKDGANGLPGQNGKTRIVYQPKDAEGNPQGAPETVATLNDGLIFTGNNESLNRHKLNSVVKIVGEGVDKATSTAFKSATGNINVVADQKDQLQIQLNRELKNLANATFVGYNDSGSVNEEAPKTVISNNGVTITPKDGIDGKNGNVVSLTKDGLNNGGNQIVNVKSGIDGLNGQNGKDGQPIASVNDLTEEQLTNVGTNAANIKDVRNATDALINKGFSIAADNGQTDNVKLGETVTYTSKDKNIVTTVSDNAIDFALNNNLTIGGPGKDGAPGKDGSIGVKGKDGSAVVVNGKDGSIGLNGKDGKDGLTFKSADGAQGVDGEDGTNGLPGKNGTTRMVYQPKNPDGTPKGDPETVATLNDGLIFTGNNELLNRHKLNTVVKIVGEGVDKATSETFKSAAGNINVVANQQDQLQIQLNRELKNLANATFVGHNDNGSVNEEAPKTVVSNNGVTITPKDGANSKDGNVVSLTKDGLNNGGNQIVNVKSGIDGLNGQNGKPITSVNDLTEEQLTNVGTNAANIKDVRNATDALINKGFSIAADNGETDHVKLGETVKYTSKDKNIVTTVSDNAIDFALNNNLTVGGPGKDGAPGKDGIVGVKGADGSTGVSLNGKDGSIGIDGKDGSNASITVKQGAKGLDGNDGQNGESKTRIVYKKPNGTTEEVATLNDGLRFVGDDGKVIDKKLNETLQISGGKKDVDDLSDDNIGVVNKDGKLVVKLAKNIDLTTQGSITIGDSVLTNNSLTVGGNSPITVNGNSGTIGGLTNKTFDPDNFTSGQAATEDQLKQVYDVANSGWDIAANGQNTTNVGPKGKVSFNNTDGNVVITKKTTDNNVTFALNNDLTIGGPNKDGQPGKDGSIGVKGADGRTGVALNGKDGTIGINGKDGSNGTMTFEQGKPGVGGKDGETKTRVVYETKDKDGNPVKEEVATLNDGLKFVGDDGKEIVKKLNETLKISGGDTDLTNLSDNNIGVVNNNGALAVKLAKDINLTKDGSVTIGDTAVNNDGLTIKNGPSVTKDGISAGNKKITNVQDGEISETSQDAVNGSQLYQVQQVANAGWNLTANGKDKGNVKPGATVDLNNKDGNIILTKEGNNVTFGLSDNLTVGGKDGKDGKIGIAGKDGKDGVTIKGDGTIIAGRNGQDGVDGSIGATGKDGASVVLNGKDGSIGLTGPKGTDGKPGKNANIAVKDGAEGVDGTNGKDGLPGNNGKTRIVYETTDKNGKLVTEQVSTLNDGLIFSGNNEETKNRQKLNTEVKVKGEGVDKTASENFKSASGNINVKANGTDTLEVQLAKAINLTKDGSVTIGDTTVNNNGLTIKDGPSVTKGGIDAKGTKITNVKDGNVTATSKDAVNGS